MVNFKRFHLLVIGLFLVSQLPFASWAAESGADDGAHRVLISDIDSQDSEDTSLSMPSLGASDASSDGSAEDFDETVPVMERKPKFSQEEKFFIAAKGNNIEGLEKGLAEGIDVDVRDLNGNTPLMMAIEFARLEAMQFLIDHGADVLARSDEDGESVLTFAAHGDPVELQVIIDAAKSKGYVKGSEHFYTFINNMDYDEMTPLCHAISCAESDDEATARATILLQAGADPNLGNPLAYAALNGYEGAVQLLLNSGARIDQATLSKDGMTPLLEAALSGNVSVVRLLLDQGADSRIADSYGNTAASYALFNGHVNVVQLFLERGIIVLNERLSNQETPLLVAINGGQPALVKKLIQLGADLTAQDPSGYDAERRARLLFDQPQPKRLEEQSDQDYAYSVEAWSKRHADYRKILQLFRRIHSREQEAEAERIVHQENLYKAKSKFKRR